MTRHKKHNDFVILKRFISTLGVAIPDILRDIEFSSKHDLYYILDFDCVFPYVWRDSPPPRHTLPYKPYGRKVIDTLIAGKGIDAGFIVVFTVFSFYELLDSFCHHIEDAERFVTFSESFRKYYHEKHTNLENPNFGSSQEIGITTGLADSELKQLLSVLGRDEIRAPVERAISILGLSGIMRGLGDVALEKGTFEKIHLEDFREISNRMYQIRSVDDRRPYDDKVFHYGIDAANIILTYAINVGSHGMAMNFVTQPRLKNLFCPEHGRSPYVPYYWMRSLLLERDTTLQMPSYRDFLTLTSRRVEELDEALANCKGFGELDEINRRNLRDFLVTYAALLSNPEVEEPPDRGVKEEELMEILDSRKLFSERFEEKAATLAEGTREIIKLNPEMTDDTLIDSLGFAPDPMVKRIRDRFMS